MFAVSRELSASCLISSATTAKPLPASPALAASIDALSARRFVDEKVALDYDNFVKIIGNYDADSDQASNTFNEFAVKSKDSLGTMNDMNEGINNISITIEESAKGVTNVAQEISQLVTAISAITVQADENKNLSEDLSDEVAKFEKV